MSKRFSVLASRTARAAGHWIAFAVALTASLAWAATGPFFHWSAGWNFAANSSTTIVTFLMVFLIQNTQNRDALAVHLKLDELIRSIDQADNNLMAAEDETDEELAELKAKYQALCDEHTELKGHFERLKGALKQNGRAEVPSVR
jgi:low affinity Fe/Cu permease